VRLPPTARSLALAVHLAVSVGWLGAVAAYLSLDLVAAASQDAQTLRSAYVGMETIAGNVIVPLAIATLLTGVLVSVGTKWGLVRHWWVSISLALTVLATVVLLIETGTIAANAAVAADPATTTAELRRLGNTLVHSIGGAIVLLGVLVLNVYKPRGMTPYGWRKHQEERRSRPPQAATVR
jgi:hypothetical protein